MFRQIISKMEFYSHIRIIKIYVIKIIQYPIGNLFLPNVLAILGYPDSPQYHQTLY